MYLRFSWIVGNAGLIQTILIVVIANVITFITAFSVASIAGNERMETGGAYFMISRLLGFQAGGSIGVPLFLSQALSIALYIIGFAESLHAVAPGWGVTEIALITLVVLLSLVSIFAGFQPVYTNVAPAYTEGNSFWSVFAIFFPAVTGILAGVSMSGDLRTPEKSIPRGTLLAVAAGFIIYMAVPGILTMFFLTTYGVLNVAAGIERAVNNPSFRPSIKVPWPINMIGAAGCFSVMFLIQPVFTIAALAVVGMIFLALQQTEKGKAGGGIWEGFWLSMFFRASDRLVRSRTGTGKNWRPLVQVFASEPEAHSELLLTASRLTEASGALAIYQIVERRIKGTPPEGIAETLSRPNVFFKRIVTEDFQEGVVVASQAEGFAAGSANTVMMGMPSNPRNDRINTRMLTHLLATPSEWTARNGERAAVEVNEIKLESIVESEDQRETALVLLGMARPEINADRDYLSRLRSIADRMVSALFVLNNLPAIRYE